MSKIHIGISGWTYPPWRGVFFPANWPQKRELEYASRQVSSIEINGTFYSLQRPSSYQAWFEATPEDFCFSVKGPRFITHLKRLKDVRIPLANFFASGVLCLGDKLGPVLWQLPPNFHYDRERLAHFFALLPRTTQEASHLARKHDGKVRGRVALKAREDKPLRHALEVRHDSFMTEEFIDLLREHDIALVFADTAGKWPFMEDVTSDFVYIRLHGDEELYVSGYTEAALEEWTRKIRFWSHGRFPPGANCITSSPKPHSEGRDVFVYFDNDVKVRAPIDAMSLAHLMGLSAKPKATPEIEIREVARTSWHAIPRRWKI